MLTPATNLAIFPVRMNYNRRSTRPDGGFYRDSRKIRGAARLRGGPAVKPIAILIGVGLLAVVAYLVFFR
jgi:hypothetical protein